jgi:hypothetical protein
MLFVKTGLLQIFGKGERTGFCMVYKDSPFIASQSEILITVVLVFGKEFVEHLYIVYLFRSVVLSPVSQPLQFLSSRHIVQYMCIYNNVCFAAFPHLIIPALWRKLADFQRCSRPEVSYN